MKELAILVTNEEDSIYWVKSLKKYFDIRYDVINITFHNWLEQSNNKNYDMYLLKAPGNTNLYKQMYDERVSILANELDKKIYPPLTEIQIYENKKYLSYWLKANKIPHPETNIFYHKSDVVSFLEKSSLPLVGKINIGASGKGVKILHTMDEAKSYVKKTFKHGIKPYIGPNFRTASIFKKMKNAYKKKGLLQKRINSYKATFSEPQKYVILQEFIPHTFEWRVVVIGNSYFAHKKVVSGEKASGSLLKDYGNPPISLLNFMREICLRAGIISASMDIFETDKGDFLVNEIQTFFGQSDSYQMKVDGIIGRYKYENEKWIFEQGDFNTNQCYDLRLTHALSLLENGK
jgi:glutathione synthase/RimK-type ligase-like ATP-grasp enzyme